MHSYLALTAVLVSTAAVSLCTEANDTTTLHKEATALAQQFVGRLKPQLKDAMQNGGPSHAIEICAVEAPKIADALSAESGWQIKRVSLKSRNPSRAQPDSWEREVLEEFDLRQAQGEPASEINKSEVTANRFRLMQAQGVEPLCLICHGENLAQPVQETLEQYYPDDWATGYSTGQIRGAISLSKAL